MEILSQPVCAGFGPSFAAEHLGEEHGIQVGRERKSRRREMVQWDASEHAWLEERGEKLYLILRTQPRRFRAWARPLAHELTLT